MKNAPNEIFLNLGDDKDVLDSDFLELPSSEIGWSAEPIDAASLRYVRSDTSLTIRSLEAKPPKFEIGDRLLYLPGFSSLMDDELDPCLPCEVVAIQASFLITKQEVCASYEYVIRFETFDDDRTVKQNFLYRDHQEALASAKESTKNSIKNYQEKVDIYKKRLIFVEQAQAEGVDIE